jgi:hypothetical protein
MNTKQSNATLQIEMYSSTAVPDDQLKPVTRQAYPKRFAARRRSEARYVNTYVPNASKTWNAKGGYILKSLTEWWKNEPV